MTDWDNLVEPARSALETLISKGDAMADRIEELEAKLAEVENQLDSARHSVTVLEGRADHFKARAEAAEAALPAVYRLGLRDAVETLRTKRTHMYTTRHDEFVQTRTRGVLEMADMIEASPTLTAAELMARIQTGEKE